MFRRSTDSQLSLFSTTSNFLSGKSENFFENSGSWHNIFRAQVTSKIDESIFKPLFTDQTGAPNASVRVMIAMMILKEANGWSDTQLFEQCRYNMLVRSALGLMNMDDAIPTESTYYLFRKRIVDYEKLTEINLFETTFASVTKLQAADFQVSGKSIRMDSKLLGSNIAWLTRYELIHESLRLFCKSTVGQTILNNPVLAEDKEFLNGVLQETGSKIVYRCNADEIKSRMHEIGRVTYKIISLLESSTDQQFIILKDLFHQQYKIEENKLIIPRPKEEISTKSIQSPHDTDCHYRNKDGNQVKGYSVNITETCTDQPLNLITNVDLRPVTASDCDFLIPAVKSSKEVIGEYAENVHADGAYHNPENQVFTKENDMNLFLNAIQGAVGRFDIILNENNELIVTDRTNNQLLEVKKVKNNEKWRVKVDSVYRYFGKKEIEASQIRRTIAAIPQSVLNIRNNVEATIFQLGYHYSNDKTRYRTQIKNKMWANIRCLWINFVRIRKYLVEIVYSYTLRPVKNSLRNFIIIYKSNNRKTKEEIQIKIKLLLQIQKIFIFGHF